MSSRSRWVAATVVLAAALAGCDPGPEPEPSSAPTTTTTTPGGDLDAARLAAVVEAVPDDGLEVREGGPRTCDEADCVPGAVRSTLYRSEELPERSWEGTAGWLREAVEPWHEAGWTIVYSVCAPTRAGTALVKELDGPFVALAQLDTAYGERTVEVTVPLATEAPDPWQTTRTMLPDAACWQEDVPPKDLVEQSTPPLTTPPR